MPNTPEPSVNDLRPIAKPGVETEPALLLDTTGSMASAVAPNSHIERRGVAQEVVHAIAAAVYDLDSQAAEETKLAQAAGDTDEAGGLMTTTFADGKATVLGDVNPDNFGKLWNEIEWGGSTYIMPGVNLVQSNYMEEFGDTPVIERPHLLLIVITDGELYDAEEFAHYLNTVRGSVFCVVAVLGYGKEHDEALAQYQSIAQGNDHLRVLSFDAQTDGTVIATELRQVAGL